MQMQMQMQGLRQGRVGRGGWNGLDGGGGLMASGAFDCVFDGGAVKHFAQDDDFSVDWEAV